MNKYIITTLIPTLAIAGQAADAQNAHRAVRQPNIVLILADDLGYGDVHCFNPEGKIPTPNLDALAAQGLRFTDAHSTSALSAPSRYSIMTGRYPWRTTLKQGVGDGFSETMIPASRNTIATELSELGYGTACIGKWHLGWHWTRGEDGQVDFSIPITDGPLERGFDYYFGTSASLDMAPYIFVENNRATETQTRQVPKDKGVHLMHGGVGGANFRPEECLQELTRKAVAHVRGWKGDKRPHFLYMPLTAPHTPCYPSPEFKGRTGLGDYADFVMMTDDAVGQVLAALRESGQYDNTLIVFASDNGCAPYAGIPALERAGHFPSYIFRGYKADVWDGGHRIPMIVSGRKFVRGGRRGSCVSDIVTLADLYATFTEAAGGSLSGRSGVAEDSWSILPLITGKGSGLKAESGLKAGSGFGSAADGQEYIVAASGSGWFSIRDQQYKLIFTPGSGGWAYPVKPDDVKGLPDRQLYDMVSDPGEKNNLIEDTSMQEVVARLTAVLREFILSGRSTPGPEAFNDTPSHWRQTEVIFR